MIPFTENSRKCRLIYKDRKQISGCPGAGMAGRGYQRSQGDLGVVIGS